MNKKEICENIIKTLDIAECYYEPAKIRRIVDYLERAYNFDKMTKEELRLMEVSIIVCVEVI